MAYTWLITKDYYAQPDEPVGNLNAAGVMGPRGCTLTAEQVRANGRPFRMLGDCNFDDADDVACSLAYEGLIVSDDGAGSEDDFGPLDDFGRPNWGCEIIQYLENGEWVTL